MRTIYKYEIALGDGVIISTHRVVHWLFAALQDGHPMVWAVVETDSGIAPRTIHVRGTGHPMTGDEGEYIGTIQMADGILVFHIFSSKKEDGANP